jgi:hypothetical protein
MFLSEGRRQRVRSLQFEQRTPINPISERLIRDAVPGQLVSRKCCDSPELETGVATKVLRVTCSLNFSASIDEATPSRASAQYRQPGRVVGTPATDSRIYLFRFMSGSGSGVILGGS